MITSQKNTLENPNFLKLTFAKYSLFPLNSKRLQFKKKKANKWNPKLALAIAAIVIPRSKFSSQLGTALREISTNRRTTLAGKCRVILPVPVELPGDGALSIEITEKWQRAGAVEMRRGVGEKQRRMTSLLKLTAMARAWRSSPRTNKIARSPAWIQHPVFPGVPTVI